MDHLLPEITEDILSRLPIKSLVRFQSASKTWYALISDSYFGNLHFSRLSKNPKLLIFNGFGFKSLACETPLNDSGALVDLAFPGERHDWLPEIIGSSHGLICITTDRCERFYVWNPSTGSCRRIPNLGYPINGCTDYLHGFGYDSSSNEFKVVVSLTRSTINQKTIYNVFSSKTNSWKKIVYPYRQEYYLPYCSPNLYASLGTYTNGALHWLVTKISPMDRTRLDNQIIAFDLANEKFRKVPIPVKFRLYEYICKLHKPGGAWRIPLYCSFASSRLP
ncbi:F-box protein At5g49610 [Jatropha curcas]|uniref:F-box protein At5g49610 n=1 Tax=Jatropha curcas TaxID=180498 RepID=UPI0009D76F53|nr:F-box protein At5g49610 [Jatropha curcas]